MFLWKVKNELFQFPSWKEYTDTGSDCNEKQNTRPETNYPESNMINIVMRNILAWNKSGNKICVINKPFTEK